MYETLVQDVVDSLDSIRDKSIRIGIGLQETESLVSLLAELRRAIHASGLMLVIYTSRDGFELPASAGTILRCSDEPENAMIADFRAGELDAIIRGQLSSASFLETLKHQFGIDNICRLALLATSSGQEFFFAPVGIDEGRTIAEKERLIELSIKLLDRLGIVPSFYVLSAGRLDDASRDDAIARSIRDAQEVIDAMKAAHEGLAIQHGEILIENAFNDGANVIIAPDGVSGNLIYRTLLHLGGGHSHGAYYLNDELLAVGPVMDTSRAGTTEEYAGAVVLALRLIVVKDEVEKLHMTNDDE